MKLRPQATEVGFNATAMVMPTILLTLSPPPSSPLLPSLSIPEPIPGAAVYPAVSTVVYRRNLIAAVCATCPLIATLSSAAAVPGALPPPGPPPLSSKSSNSFLSGIANTRSWFQYYGDGFAIRVPPKFEDVMEPEDLDAGLSLYGDKAKPKTYAARFASPDGSEVVSVVIRPTNQLKITFLEAKDITDLGSLKEATKIFVPGSATLYSARTLKIKEDEGYRNYYYYEFGRDKEHVALVATVYSGKAVVAGASAPQNKWEDDGVQLRSAAVSLTIV